MNTQEISMCEQKAKKRTIVGTILNFCAYTHLWNVIKTAVKERKFPAAARQGLFIFLLGIFCPIFWVALFNGVKGAELRFHATHSGIVAAIGLVLMIVGLLKNKN